MYASSSALPESQINYAYARLRPVGPGPSQGEGAGDDLFVGNEHDLIQRVILKIRPHAQDVSYDDILRAKNVLMRHNVTPSAVLHTIRSLDANSPSLVGQATPNERRLALAALVGIAIGSMNVQKSQYCVEVARFRPEGGIAHEVATMGVAVGVGAAGGWLYMKALAASSAKIAAIKTGACGTGAGLLALAGSGGLVLVGAAAIALSIVAVRDSASNIKNINRAIAEPLISKDMRLLESIRRDDVPVPNVPHLAQS